MDCKQFLDYLDAEFSNSPSPDALAHLSDCADCRRAAALKDETLGILRALPEPPVPAGFADRMFDAVSRADARQPHRGASRAWALGMAAALALGIGIGIVVQWAATAPAGNYQVRNGTILVPPDAVTQVRIALDSAHPFQNVAFTVNVPAGMQLRGHPGEQQVAWSGVLVQGRNVLNLELVAKPGATGTLETDLEYAGHSSTYKVQVAAAGKPSLRSVIHSLLARMSLT